MISVGVAKLHARIDDDFEDELVQEMIDSAQAVVERHTGWYLGTPEQRDLVLSPFLSSKSLWLPQPPEEVIQVEGLDPEDWELRGQRLIRIGESKFWRRDDEYVVTVVDGYELDDGPAALRQAVAKIVSGYYHNREMYTLGVEPSEIMEGMRLTLSPYRRGRT